MQSINQSIAVGFKYAVHFTHGVFDTRNEAVISTIKSTGSDGTEKVLFVLDEGVARHHPQLIDSIGKYCVDHGLKRAAAGTPLVVPGGEVAKNDPAHLQSVYQAINDRGICRHSFVIVIGGGAVLDVAGYAAATAHRGIRVVRVPTTVLAQNDSGVGVKTGVNAFGKKNFIGAFAPPHAVINDPHFLTTLERRDWMAGTSEAVKVGLIRDRAFFDWVNANAAALVNRDMPAMENLIFRCAELHCQHIANSGDPFEMGSARPLDFGHWAAHKLEQMTDFQLRHGEAVAIGLMLDVTYSGLIGSISQDDVRAVHRCLMNLQLPTCLPAMRDAATLLRGLEEFREHLGGRLTITLLRKIGEGFEVNEIDRPAMQKAIEQLSSNR